MTAEVNAPAPVAAVRVVEFIGEMRKRIRRVAPARLGKGGHVGGGCITVPQAPQVRRSILE